MENNIRYTESSFKKALLAVCCVMSAFVGFVIIVLLALDAIEITIK